jgi:single-stranded-DNA-specific exonuclease
MRRGKAEETHPRRGWAFGLEEIRTRWSPARECIISSAVIPTDWIPAESFAAAGQLAQRLGVDPVVAQVLANRGLADEADARQFLSPTLNDLHPPEALAQIDPAVERIVQAIERREPIFIYGDYDVDGLSGVAILWQALRLAGVEPEVYIPHRVREGYGLNAAAVRAIAARGGRLLITVDCGVTAIKQVAAANAAGMDVIVTDHHELEDRLPEAVAVLHPRHPAGQYPFGKLCGAAVAFKLAWALGRRLSGGEQCTPQYRDFLVSAVGLAALGTIADIVPLVEENRVIAKFGLEGLAAQPPSGLAALLEQVNLAGKELSGYHVGFLLGPRLNAAGRMGHAREALELLTTAEGERARAIATILEQHNEARRRTEQRIFDRALELIDAQGIDPATRASLVLADPDWHVGVVGIVASRLIDRFCRPTILLGRAEKGEHLLGGSGRSIRPLHLADALGRCGDLLVGCGGHAMAAGLSLREGQLAAFTEAFERVCREQLTEDDLRHKLHIDAEVQLAAVDTRLTEQLQRLAPFGQGNPRPLLAAFDVELTADPQRMGRTGAHMTFFASQQGSAHRCVAFRQGERADGLHRGDRIDIAFRPSLNQYRGVRSLELVVKDLRVRS